MNSQSRSMSLVESCANVVVGFAVNLAGQVLIFPLFGITVSFVTNLDIGLAFTGISIARSYGLRRAFEAIRVRAI